ncbi:MAG: FixH family protein [Magnetococcales bacterium]|nr:FixH family protein [Magnetococcales bacterium]
MTDFEQSRTECRHTPEELVGKEPWPKWILWLFLVVLGVNILMVLLAQGTFNGLSTRDSYAKGLAYNEVLNAQQAQEALGWQVKPLSLKPVVRQSSPLVIRITDRGGNPVRGISLKGSLYRPVQEGFDQNLAFDEGQPGEYRAMTTAPLPGWWEIRIQSVDPAFTWVERLQAVMRNEEEQR